jgi:hypothetical protein
MIVFMIYDNYNTVCFGGSSTVYKLVLAFFLNVKVKHVINWSLVYALIR